MESKPDENNVKHNIFLLYSDKVSFFHGFNFCEANAIITLNFVSWDLKNVYYLVEVRYL